MISSLVTDAKPGRHFFPSCSEVNSKGYSEFDQLIRARLQHYPLFQFILNKQQPPFGAKIFQDIRPQTLSVPRSDQFSKCGSRKAKSIEEQIMSADKYWSIFFPKGGYCVYYPSNLFRNARSFENQVIFNNYSPLATDTEVNSCFSIY